jgi:hypothetical protein
MLQLTLLLLQFSAAVQLSCSAWRPDPHPEQASQAAMLRLSLLTLLVLVLLRLLLCNNLLLFNCCAVRGDLIRILNKLQKLQCCSCHC